MTKSNLGEFLTKLRLSRGADNIKLYTKELGLPITSTYYRDLELGKKQVSAETAEAVCQALGADESEFYSCLLKDIIPEQAFQLLTNSCNVENTCKSQPEIDAKHILAETRHAFDLPVHRDGLSPGHCLSLYSLGSIDKRKLPSIYSHIARLWHVLDEANEDDSGDEFFCTTILSTRSDYHPV